jgi:arginyl-tRNA synthetase
MADPLEELRVAICAAADSLRDGAAGSIVPTLERPPKPELGDYSTNAAMLLAPARGQPPREIAERLCEELGARLGPSAERIEVAGPGFVNVFLADRWHRQSIAAMLAAGPGFGRGSPQRPERVLIEFVSANPTGPRAGGLRTGTRSRACWSLPATRSSANTCSMTSAGRFAGSRSPSPRGCGAASRPRTDTEAST